jgi:hypothetical protein
VGLLDDLKKEADQALRAKEAEKARQAELERVYRTEIAPRLIKIHRYLNELTGHLQTVGRVIEIGYDLPGLGRLENLRQDNYRLFIDGHEAPRKVTFQCDCTLPDEKSFEVSQTAADETRRFLVSQQCLFTEWPIRDARQQITGFMFRVKVQVRAGLLFEADIENSRIRVVSHHFEELTTRPYHFGYANVNDEWLDGLGRYVLRQKKILGDLPLSEEARARIRRLAEEQKARQLQEVQEAEARESQSKSGDSGLFRNLRGLLKSDKS